MLYSESHAQHKSCELCAWDHAGLELNPKPSTLGSVHCRNCVHHAMYAEFSASVAAYYEKSVFLDHTTLIKELWCYSTDLTAVCPQALDDELDEQISSMKQTLELFNQHPYYTSRFYVTREDICNVKCFGEDSLFAVRAPIGTTIEVPDPTEGQEAGRRRYRYATPYS